MTIHILKPTYLENNYINSLRYQLCEIIFEGYKTSNLYLEQLLQEKKEALDKLYSFLKKHPEISEFKENSKYWYPYENVDSTKELGLHNYFYPNTLSDDGITYFGKKYEALSNSTTYDYLVDPVKLQFNLICYDLTNMECESLTAKEITKINNELFSVLFNTVGDTISYNGLTTLEHVYHYLQNRKNHEIRIKNDPTYSGAYKQELLKKYNHFNDVAHLLNDIIAFCEADKLEKELPQHDRQKNFSKKKI